MPVRTKLNATNYHRSLASLMVLASNEVLYSKHKKWVAVKHPGVSLEFRVGSGKATYHSSPRLRTGVRKHQITYGVKMIASKLTSRNVAMKWRTGKEIKCMGYYDKNVTMQTLLAHTILHEYAHFYQTLTGGREYGSVHNDEFYRILNRLHECGLADDLLDWLMQHDIFRNMSFHN
tara:strand:+ start:13251 stop:13778 length:528 start_codon:yes stop_codon:yes gene_type:complete